MMEVTSNVVESNCATPVYEQSVRHEHETRYVRDATFDYSKEANTITGYASVFNVAYNLGSWNEIIDKRAFDNALKSNDEIKVLHNHNVDFVMGSTSGKSQLSLKADDTGLMFSFQPNQCSWSEDCKLAIENGDIQGCSFGFLYDDIDTTWEERDGKIYNTIHNIRRLIEVSPCVFPANPHTSISLRGYNKFVEETALKEIQKLYEKELSVRRYIKLEDK